MRDGVRGENKQFLGGIHKRCPYLGGDRGLAAKRTKVDRGRERVQLKVDILFSVVSVGERRAFKSHVIIIVLC